VQRLRKQAPSKYILQELEAETAEFVCLKRKIGLPLTCETVIYKTWELAETHSHGIISMPAWVNVSI